jgi:general secretion pathway protein I
MKALLKRFSRKTPASVGNRATGFTLLEVLVALAIVGFAMGAITGVFSNGLLGHETAAGAETALAVAEGQLALAAAAPHRGANNGVYDGRFAWQTTVAPFQDAIDKDVASPKSLPLLYRVAVNVSWSDGRRSRQVSLSTLRLGVAP